MDFKDENIKDGNIIMIEGCYTFINDLLLLRQEIVIDDGRDLLGEADRSAYEVMIVLG